MEPSDLKPKCVTCSLLTSSSSSQDPGGLKMTQLVTFLVPGLYFSILGLRWSILNTIKWTRASRYQQYQEAGLPPPPEYVMKIRRRPFPWEGFVKIVISILVSILSGSLDHSNLIIINVYIFFLISGVVDILIFYHGYRLLPEGLQSLLLSASFSVAALCYFSLLDSGNSQAVSLVIGLTLLLSFISLLETVIDNRLIKFCRSYFTILLASWLVHATSLSSVVTSAGWVISLFVWHAAGWVLVASLLLVTCQLCTPSILHQPAVTLVPDTESGAQLVPVKMMPLRSAGPAIREVDRNSERSGLSVVDVEPWDNVTQKMTMNNYN